MSTVARPPWLDRLPEVIVSVDVETTGIGAKEKIVSFGAVRLETTSLLEGVGSLSLMHVVCDPGKDSHWKASSIHGYSDWDLRHQQCFSENAQAAAELLNSGSLVVAHNADFDLPFIDRALISAGYEPVSKPIYCTMWGFRDLEFRGKSTLDAICRRIGIKRRGSTHGALEDAWLALQVYLWLQDCPLRFEPLTKEQCQPSNWIEPPQMPVGRLPRRKKVNQ